MKTMSKFAKPHKVILPILIQFLLLIHSGVAPDMMVSVCSESYVPDSTLSPQLWIGSEIFNPERTALIMSGGQHVTSEAVKVLIVIPAFAGDQVARSPGVSYLSSSIASKEFMEEFLNKYPEWNHIGGKIKHIEVKILDLGLAPEEFSLKDYLSQQQFDIVGVSALTPVYEQAKQIAEIVEQADPEALRIIGGHHATLFPEDVMKESRFQVAVVGYGEETLIEVMLRYAAQGMIYSPEMVADLPGICFRQKDGTVTFTGRRAGTIDMDSHPYAMDSVSFYVHGDAYPRDIAKETEQFAYISTSRGCPFSCLYCAGKIMCQRTVVYRSVQHVLQEIEALFLKGYNRFLFWDETFNLKRERTLELCRGIRMLNEKNFLWDIRWAAYARADLLDKEMLDEMAESGCVALHLGIETGDEKLALEIKQLSTIDMEQIPEMIRYATQKGIRTHTYFINGFPGQGWQSLLRTASLIEKARPRAVKVFDLQAFPGTFYDYLLRERNPDVEIAPPKFKSASDKVGFSSIFNSNYGAVGVSREMPLWELEAARKIIYALQFNLSMAAFTRSSDIKQISREKSYAIRNLLYELSIFDLILRTKGAERIEYFFKSAETKLRQFYELILKAGDEEQWRKIRHEEHVSENGDIFPISYDELNDLFASQVRIKPEKAELFFDDFIKNITLENGYEILSGIEPGSLIKLFVIFGHIWDAVRRRDTEMKSFENIEFTFESREIAAVLEGKIAQANEEIFEKVNSEEMNLFFRGQRPLNVLGMLWHMSKDGKTLIIETRFLNDGIGGAGNDAKSLTICMRHLEQAV